MIGPYRLLGVLGRGGMGVVYRAEHVDTGEPAAVKTVSVSSEGLLSGIRREIHALARIRHPGVVRILDEGVERGVPWYAMELLPGVTLRRFVALPEASTSTVAEVSTATEVAPRRWLPHTEDGHSAKSSIPIGGSLRSCLTIIRRLCAPLAYLHGEGIVHRDLKPDNILLRPDGMPVLVDFGLVSRFGGSLSREALELAARTAGTVGYMAPEQLGGELLDARADLYSLGCILYELLTGRPPFSGNPAEILVAHLNLAPVPPSALADGMPPELDTLVLRLLAKDPRQRLGHADDVAVALASLGAENGLCSTASRPRAYLYRPGLAGRDDMLRNLHAKLTRLEAGAGGLVLIAGESGVGKTRLALELARSAQRRGLGVLTGEGLPLSLSERGTANQCGGPLQVLSRPLQAIADRCRSWGTNETIRLLGRHGKVLAPYEPSLARLPGQEQCPEPVELPAALAWLRLFRALTETFTALVSDRPLLVVLDDLQWADELTLGWLEFLLRQQRLDQMPLLIVGTYRSEEISEGLQRLVESGGVEVAKLDRLDEEGVGAMVGDMLALALPPKLFARYLAKQSEGNPFFVAEYLRTAIAQQVLYRDGGGRWQVAETSESKATETVYEALPIPGSLRELVGRRLEALSPAARAASEAAAVLGREVDEILLAEVADIDSGDVMEVIQVLLARQVLEEVPTGRLRFSHDKIREVAYERIAEDRRSRLHHAAAEVLVRRTVGDTVEELGMLGHHWERAGVLEKARACCLAGARKAASDYAHNEAERLYRRYLSLVGTPTAESLEARNELGHRILRIQGRIQDAIEQHSLALNEARQIGARRIEGQSLGALGVIHKEAGNLKEARDLYERALAVFREVGARQLEGVALDRLALLNQEQGRMAEADALYQLALAAHREVANRKLEGITSGNLAILRHLQGHLEEAAALFENALTIHREISDREDEGITLSNLANLHVDFGRLDEAQRLLEQALAIHAEIGNRGFEGMTLANLAIVHSHQGRASKARTFFDRAMAIFGEAGAQRFAAVALACRATLERRTGGIAEAERLLDQAEETLKVLGDEFYLGVCRCERGHVALAEERSASLHLAEALHLAATLGAGPGSELGQAVSRFQRAVEAAEAGLPLFRGECVGDIPEGLRNWLAASGQLSLSTG